MWQALSENPVLTVVLPWIVAACMLALALLPRQARFLSMFTAIFAIEIAADAYLTGPWTPVHGPRAFVTGISIFFVITGDFRYFVLLQRAESPRRPVVMLIRAVIWAF